jgi:hypothetical protein
MTGAQAETWRRFSFSTAPGWAFWVGGLLVAALTARRASGYLPLTHASVKKLRTLTWGTAALIPLALVMFAIGLAVPDGTVTFVLVTLAFATLIVGVLALAVVRRAFGPRGKVLEPQPGHYQSLVELNNVHPAFAFAVQQLQQMRSQQAYASQSPNP